MVCEGKVLNLKFQLSNLYLKRVEFYSSLRSTDCSITVLQMMPYNKVLVNLSYSESYSQVITNKNKCNKTSGVKA